MHVSSDQPLLGFPAGLLGARRKTSLAQNHDRSLEIAFSLLKGALAFHKSDASFLPELFHKFGRYAHIKAPYKLPLARTAVAWLARSQDRLQPRMISMIWARAETNSQFGPRVPNFARDRRKARHAPDR